MYLFDFMVNKIKVIFVIISNLLISLFFLFSSNLFSFNVQLVLKYRKNELFV